MAVLSFSLLKPGLVCFCKSIGGGQAKDPVQLSDWNDPVR
jgi:hypothetical protein